jgi:hypothetical protein
MSHRETASDVFPKSLSATPVAMVLAASLMNRKHGDIPIRSIGKRGHCYCTGEGILETVLQRRGLWDDRVAAEIAKVVLGTSLALSNGFMALMLCSIAGLVTTRCCCCALDEGKGVLASGAGNVFQIGITRISWARSYAHDVTRAGPSC